MFENEEWRPVGELPHYEVSNYGRVRNARDQKVRKLSISDAGFPILTLYGADSKTRNLRQVNKLVALAYLPEPQYRDMTSVWHIDGDLLNCNAENLSWDTRKRVLEWNRMHREGRPAFKTPRVRNNRTGEVYENAYECGLAVGDTEVSIDWKIERGSPRYSYIGDNDL